MAQSSERGAWSGVLHLVYRSYGGENLKGRPEFYSKRAALASFLRAVKIAVAAGVNVEILFINDGPVDRVIHLIQRKHTDGTRGAVFVLPSVGLRGSYMFALQAADLLDWGEHDVVWYGEDDYLYQPGAFVELVEAVRSMPEVDYFALYGTVPGKHTAHPKGWECGVESVINGVSWERLVSTTSSFGGRVSAMRADMGIFTMCMKPHRKMLRDHDTCVVLQGCEPYRWGDLLKGLVFNPTDLFGWVRNVWLFPFLVATNLRSHRKPANRRSFVVASPNLATHMEIENISPGVDWSEIANGQLTLMISEKEQAAAG